MMRRTDGETKFIHTWTSSSSPSASASFILTPTPTVPRKEQTGASRESHAATNPWHTLHQPANVLSRSDHKHGGTGTPRCGCCYFDRIGTPGRHTMALHDFIWGKEFKGITVNDVRVVWRIDFFYGMQSTT